MNHARGVGRIRSVGGLHGDLHDLVPADHSNAILGGATRAVNRQSGFRRSSGCSGSDNSGRVVANVEVEISWYGATADCTSDEYIFIMGGFALLPWMRSPSMVSPRSVGQRPLAQAQF